MTTPLESKQDGEGVENKQDGKGGNVEGWNLHDTSKPSRTREGLEPLNRLNTVQCGRDVKGNLVVF